MVSSPLPFTYIARMLLSSLGRDSISFWLDSTSLSRDSTYLWLDSTSLFHDSTYQSVAQHLIAPFPSC